jgi:hypothetical protein
MPQYMQIGYTFKLGKSSWRGAVVASPEAFYLLQEMKASTAMLGAQFGLVGALVAAGAAKLAEPSETRTCDISQLDPAVLNHPDWPLKKRKKGDMVVVAREDVGEIKHPRWTNLIKFDVDGEPASIEYALFRGKKVRQFLIDSGWPVSWGE